MRFSVKLAAGVMIAVLLAGCGGANPGAQPSPQTTPDVTAAPVQTPAVTQSPVETPAVTAEPVETPAVTQAPIENPAVTQTPAETPAPSPLPSSEPKLPVEEVLELHFTKEELPEFNGSTSTQPLAHAVASVLTGESRETVEEWMHFSRTTESYRRLMRGEADILIAAEPAESVVAEMMGSPFEWELAPIATDALVFLVNEDNPVDDLTVEQVQKIYTGEITNWKQVGGEDREIIPFQRNAEAGSQTLMKKLVMGEIGMMEPPVEYLVDSMAGLIEAVRSFDGSPGAIGYTVYYYANDMNMADGLKVVSVGGAKPDAATIRSGRYPFTNPYYAAIDTLAGTDSPERQIFEWLQGPVGQSLIRHEGYVSILENPAAVEWDLGETTPIAEKYTRLSPEPMEELVPSDDYGELLVYVGAQLESAEPWMWDIDRYGLVTCDGMIVTDPVYDNVYRLNYYDTRQSVSRCVDILALVAAKDLGGGLETVYALAAADGSWVSDFRWIWVNAVDESRIWTVEPDGTGVMRNEKLEELWRLPLPEGENKWLYQGGMNGGMWWRDGIGQIYQGEIRMVTADGTWLNVGKDYTYAEPAGEGLYAVQSAQSGKWGYADENGNPVIEAAYLTVDAFYNGKAIVERDGRRMIIDPRGNVLLESKGYIVRQSDEQGDWYASYWQEWDGEDTPYIKMQAYDADLNPLEWGRDARRTEWGEDLWWYATEEGLDLSTPYKTILLPVPEGTEVQEREGELILVRRTENGKDLWAAWNTDGVCLIEEAPMDYLSLIYDNATGEAYLYAQQPDGSAHLYDRTGRYLMECPNWPDISNGLISVRTEMSYGYKNPDNEWVFRISLMKGRGD